MAVKIFESKKHVFWQAFFLTVLFFFFGLVMGTYLEQSRAEILNSNFYESEVLLYDSFALNNLIENPSISCEQLVRSNVRFADRIYEEARELERFDESSKLTQSIKTIHKKYDVLRTLLWINVISVKEKCPNIVNSVVYLYIYDTEEISIRSEQAVWSKILGDLKTERGSEVILIPIAVDQGVNSLDSLNDIYGINSFPSVIINEEHVISEIKTAKELGNYLIN
ncbi:MAG: hypothetical protein WDZ77_01700 [Candidatus Pacearchaeota archaeon]